MLAHKFREAVESEDVSSRPEFRLQNVPRIKPPALGLITLPEAWTRERLPANCSQGLPRQRLRNLSDLLDQPTTSGRPTERRGAELGGIASRETTLSSCGKLEDGASVADRQQKAGGTAREGSQEGSQCSRRAGIGWQCPFPAVHDRAMCLEQAHPADAVWCPRGPQRGLFSPDEVRDQ